MDNSGPHQWRWHPVFRDYYKFERRGSPGTTTEHDLIWARSMLPQEEQQPQFSMVPAPPLAQYQAISNAPYSSSAGLPGPMSDHSHDFPLDKAIRATDSSSLLYNPTVPTASESASMSSFSEPRTATPSVSTDTPRLSYPGPSNEENMSQDMDNSGRIMTPFMTAASTSTDTTLLVPDGYEIIRTPRAYFKKGRIFKIIWSEPRGELGTGAPTNNTINKTPSDVGVSTSSVPHIKTRMFVVVRPRTQHCLCLPIYTYTQQGTSKTGVKAEDHAPLIQDNTVVEYHPGEEQEKLRKALYIILEDPTMQWNPLSRINLSQVQTIQYNIRVRTVGRVLPDCLPDLEALFREAIGLSDD